MPRGIPGSADTQRLCVTGSGREVTHRRSPTALDMRCLAGQHGLGQGAAPPAWAKQVWALSVGTDTPSRSPQCQYLAVVPPYGRGHTNQSIPRGRDTQAGPEDPQQEERCPLQGQASRGAQGTQLLKLETATKPPCCLSSRGRPPQPSQARPHRANSRAHVGWSSSRAPSDPLFQGRLPTAGPRTHCT